MAFDGVQFLPYNLCYSTKFDHNGVFEYSDFVKLSVILIIGFILKGRLIFCCRNHIFRLNISCICRKFDASLKWELLSYNNFWEFLT